MTQSVTKATPELLAQLRTPEALAAIQVARDNKWLMVDEPSLQAVFADDKEHPVYKLLEEDAKTGGLFGLVQYSILAVFFGLAFGMTIFKPHMPAMLFVMWGAIATATALLYKKHPALIMGKSKK
ncbi:33 kDa chaperonin [Novimethylophilus kurashikiensis]|uniref:33 kDa chaperonin n=1 Tax=Novimethylophilus kurashikiensis TaxID=1825523 RepID=A0A2R5F8Z6_9PROT|nr:hypothetical protein [Novimethylophilus kurashikiensis]GBG14505.1 33 kDa chaperonin [Novimethylophilus kurashikiensis]